MAAKDRRDAVSAMNVDERERTRRLFDGEIYVRANAVVQQARRLREGGQSGLEYMAACWLLAEAVRATLRAGEVCLLFRNEEESSTLEDALRRIQTVIPDAVAVRDALEHFDDYLLGLGRRQAPGYSYSQVYERGTHLRVRVGPWTLDVDSAEAAATHLASVAIAGRDYLNLLDGEEL